MSLCRALPTAAAERSLFLMDDDAGGSKSKSQSAQFPPRLCPQCRGENLACDLCHGTRKVSHFLAAAWLSEHPEIRVTPKDFPAVSPSKSGKDPGENT